ncbi:hypothetical protein PWA37_003978 [Arxiozyma heterogenica]
MLYALYIVLKD